VEVDLVTVEVMVLDKKGHPVRNLTRENFQLFEDGKQQDIVTFTEVTEDPKQMVPTSLADAEDSGLMRGKVVLILFDDSHITPSQLAISRQSAERYVKEQMRPMDLFAVASYGMSLKLLQNYTHDAAKVIEAIRQPAVSFASPTRAQEPTSVPGMQEPSGIPSRGGSRIPMESQQTRLRVVSLFRALNTLSSSVAPVRGKKVILVYSEDFPASQDVQSDYEYAVNSAKRANVAFYTIDLKGLNAGPIGGIPMPQEDSGKQSIKDSFRNASAPVKYFLSRLGQLPSTGIIGTQSSAGNSLLQQTKPPTPTPTPPPTTPPPTTAPPATTGANIPKEPVNLGPADSQDSSRFAQRLVDNILRGLASQTGGVAIFNTSEFNARLNDLSQGLNNYYVLGFQSNNPRRDGKFRRLEVKTDLKSVELRHRPGYVDPRPLDVLAGTKGEKSIMNAIASPAAATQLPVTFRAVYFYESPGLARVPVAARIKTAAVELKKRGDQLAGELNIMGVANGEDGSLAARFSETMPLLMEKDKEAAFRTQGLIYRNHFKLRPGKYQLRIAVADSKGKVGSAEQTLVVPPVVAGDLASSSLILAEKANRLPSLIQDLQVKLLEEDDPLIYKGLQVIPMIEYRLPVNSPISIIFKLYNLSPGTERHLVTHAQLTSEKGETLTLPVIDLDGPFYSTGKTEGVIGINLPFNNVVPGKYRLAVETSEGSSKRAITLQTDLLFQ
jgi:VWFA-related protein